VIGPTRLNYARVIPMVDYTAKVVSKLIGGVRLWALSSTGTLVPRSGLPNAASHEIPEG
jgi:hypothetical protein